VLLGRGLQKGTVSCPFCLGLDDALHRLDRETPGTVVGIFGSLSCLKQSILVRLEARDSLVLEDCPGIPRQKGEVKIPSVFTEGFSDCAAHSHLRTLSNILSRDHPAQFGGSLPRAHRLLGVPPQHIAALGCRDVWDVEERKRHWHQRLLWGEHVQFGPGNNDGLAGTQKRKEHDEVLGAKGLLPVNEGVALLLLALQARLDATGAVKLPLRKQRSSILIPRRVSKPNAHVVDLFEGRAGNFIIVWTVVQVVFQLENFPAEDAGESPVAAIGGGFELCELDEVLAEAGGGLHMLLGGVLPPKIVGLDVDRGVFVGIFLCPDDLYPALGRKEAILLGLFGLVLLMLLPCRAARSLVERTSGEAFAR